MHSLSLIAIGLFSITLSISLSNQMSFYLEVCKKKWCHNLVCAVHKYPAFAIPLQMETFRNLFNASAVYLQYNCDE